MPMSAITIYIEAIGLCGPGLDGWRASETVLRNESQYTTTPTKIPASESLPAAERRRVGVGVKLALACSSDALEHSTYKASDLLSVFSSSGGDGDNCHVICEALASSDRLISPTRFTNSVHNAPSGYWGIALQSRKASTSLCAFDGSFSAGFLEACTQAVTSGESVLLIAYDTPYPEPLRSVRPILHSMGVTLLITPHPTPQSVAKVHVSLGQSQVSEIQNAELEALRQNVPAARSLPLLIAIANKDKYCELALDLFTNQQLLLKVEI
jgi:Beta-ketoacyl synthase, N-terminal domain